MPKQIPAINSDLTSTVDDWAYDFLIKYLWYVDSEGYFACNDHGTLWGQQIHGKRMSWFVISLDNDRIKESAKWN